MQATNHVSVSADFHRKITGHDLLEHREAKDVMWQADKGVVGPHMG